MKRINSYYCLTEALTKSVNKEALCVSQSMFSMEILSHFSRLPGLTDLAIDSMF